MGVSTMVESFFVEKLALSELWLMNNKNVLWLILFPRREGVTELIDLSDQDQAQLLKEISQVSRMLKTHFPCDKLNIAMLGNVLPELHVHVMARRFDDAYFPKPAFGLPGEPYPVEEADALINQIRGLGAQLAKGGVH